MTKKESLEIKSEILKKEGSVTIGGTFSISEVVLLSDILEIINSHVESEDKNDNSSN